MVSYRTEEEQVEALKNWWAENGKSTLLSVVVAVAAVFGWQGWQKHQQAQIEDASLQYQNLLSVASRDGSQLSDEQRATAVHLSEQIKLDHPGSTYAQFAAFYRARLAVQDGALDVAEQQLRWVLDRAATPEITLQAQLRLGRVLLARERYEDALAVIPADSGAYAAAFEELRGDVFRARGQQQEAVLAYQKAAELNKQGESAAVNPLLELKLQSLKSDVAAQSAKTGGA